MDQMSAAALLKLHPAIREDVRWCVEECSRRGFDIRIVQGIRSFQEQDALYAQGRTSPGRIITKARAGQSYHCYSEDTEVLTNNGWKYFNDITLDDMVLTFLDGKISYETPKAFIKKEFNGDMVRIKTRSVDLLVTPEHRMVVKKKTSGDWDSNWNFIQAKDIDYRYKIPTSGVFNFPEQATPPICVDKELWWEFMGWYLTEGSCCGTSDGVKRTHNGRYKISISQKRNTNEFYKIENCLKKLGINFRYEGHDFIMHSKDLWSILFPLGNSHTKRIPRYLLAAPKHLLEILFDSMVMGDGTNYKGREAFYSVSKGMADDFMELCVLLGKSVVVVSRTPKPHMMPHGEMLKTFNLQYQVSTRRRLDHEIRDGMENNKRITRERYCGFVFCVETDAGALVVRRNGKVSISGNCYGLAVDCALLHKDGKVSWDLHEDLDMDKQADWMEMISVFKSRGFTAGADWPTPDNPHFEKTFGNNWRTLLNRYNAGKLNGGYVDLV